MMLPFHSAQKISQKESLEKATDAIVAYVSLLDGTKKKLPEDLFDEIYQTNFTGIIDNRHFITRQDLKEIHSGYFMDGCNAKIIHLRQVGECSIDMKLRLHSEKGDLFIRKLYTIKDGKVATVMKYTATLASMYPSDSAKKQLRPRHYYSGSTIVECAVASKVS